MEDTRTYRIGAFPYVQGAIECLYAVNIFDRRILTSATRNPYAVTRWINLVKTHRINGVLNVGIEFGFDCNNNCIGILQLYVKGRCLVFYVPAGRLHPDLDAFLANPNNHFFGIDIADKLEALRTMCHFQAVPVCTNVPAPPPAELAAIQALYACADVFIKTRNHL